MRTFLYRAVCSAALAWAGLCRAASDDYMVVDLSAGIGATNYPISYLSDVPVGGWTDEYKTSKLVLRKIPRGSFMMGSPTNEPGRATDGSEDQHMVTLTNDFYIGVFEVTEGQYQRVFSSSFPDNSTVPANSSGYYVDLMNNFLTAISTGTSTNFSLPNEAQWEYACRAGSTTMFFYGSDETILTNYAWYIENSAGFFSSVGDKISNGWGLYDMHGNAEEACWALTGPAYIMRGGDVSGGAYNCRSARRGSAFDVGDLDIIAYMDGFRICLTVPVKKYAVTVTNGTAEAASGTNGQVIAIWANPPAAFMLFDRWAGDTQAVANVFATNTTVTISGADVALEATYKAAPYTLTVFNGSGDGQYARGDVVPVTADPPAAMMMFDHWKVVPEGVSLGARFVAGDASTALTMPGMDLELTALYTNLPTYTLTVQGGTGGGSYTNGQVVAIAAIAPSSHQTFLWTGDTVSVADVHAWETTFVMPARAATVTATYPPVLYPLTVHGGTGGGSYTNGQQVTVVATNRPSAWHAFDVWLGDTNAVSDAHAVTTTVTVAGETDLTPAYRPLPVPANTYLVVDLAASQTNSAVSYLDQPPEEGWSQDYLTDKLVLRKITGGSFVMGSVSGETDRLDESQHAVTLTKVFYLGLFEVTQGQWRKLTGAWPSFYSNEEDRVTHPVEKVSYANIRGSSNGAKWPASSAVDGASFMGLLRAKTGDAAFDLPTEAQWEYACRAGTTGAYAGPLNDMAVFSGNSGGSTGPVGQKSPNAWGLYDMHGNVYELCLDWYAGNYSATNQIDPKGATGSSMNRRIMRGGAYAFGADNCRSAYRGNLLPTNALAYAGLRVARTAGALYPLTVVDGTVNTGGLFLAGTPVAVSAVRKDPAAIFSRWIVQPAHSKLGALFQTNRADTVVTMPTNGVVLTASYTLDPRYTVVTVTGGSGSGTYTNGQSVALTADAPPTWYAFDRWTGDTAGVADVAAAETTLLVGGGTVRLTGTYKPRDDLPADVNWLRVIGNGATNSQLVQAGTSVPVAAPAPPTGKVFGWWLVTPADAALGAGFDANAAATALVMPAQAVTLTAYYVQNPGTSYGYLDVRLVDQAGQALPNATWSPDGLTWYVAGKCPLKASSYTLRFKAPGVSWVAPANKAVTVAKNVTLAVTGTFTWVPVVTCSVVKADPRDAVTLSPTNGQVLVGKAVTLTARPYTTSAFVQWSDGDGALTKTVAPPTNAAYTATFRLKSSYTQPPVLTGASYAATVGVVFSNAVAINERPATFAATGLPPGLALNSKTGMIGGVPTVAGTYSVQVKATNPNLLVSAPVTVLITVAPLAEKAQGTLTGYACVDAGGGAQVVKGTLSMTVSTVGRITAKVTAQATSYSFSGTGWSGLSAEGVYRVRMQTLKGETLEVAVDAATGLLSGSVANGALGTQGWQLAGQRNAFIAKTASDYVAATNELARYKGYYTVALPVYACESDALANEQNGKGYVTLTVKDGGAVAVAGKLAEGTVFSSSATLLVDEGGAYVPVFVPLYTARGVFSGLLHIQANGPGLDDNRVEAFENRSMLWLYPGKSATATQDRFTAGLLAAGAFYEKVATLRTYYAGTSFSAEGQTWLVPLVFSSTGVASLATGADNPASATLSAVPATGLFSGTFKVPSGSATQTVSHFGVFTRDGDLRVGAGSYIVPRTVTAGSVSYTIKPSFTVTVQ